MGMFMHVRTLPEFPYSAIANIPPMNGMSFYLTDAGHVCHIPGRKAIT